jgi:hypothetical protein
MSVRKLFGGRSVTPDQLDRLIQKTIEECHPGTKCPCAICLVMEGGRHGKTRTEESI